MGKRGPPPLPSELKKLRGTYRKSRAPKNEARPDTTAAVDCPSWLPAEAMAEWRRVSKELRKLGLLARIDRAALAAYCLAYAEFEAMERQLKKVGHTQKSESGYVSQRPEVAIRNKAAERMLKFITQFGMTPASRTRIEVTPTTPEVPEKPDSDPTDNEFDRFREKKGSKKAG